MMGSVLSALACVPFGLLAAVAWTAHRRARRYERGLSERETNEAFAVAALRSFVEASRTSSRAVVEALSRSLRERDASIDVVMTFVPDGNDLACIFAGGVRAEHFEGLRLQRDTSCALPAQAAAAGHRARGEAGGVLIPTDRRAIAVPMRVDDDVRAVVYVSSAGTNGPFDEDAIVRTIEHASAPWAIALEREADRSDATYDGLTGLLTPRAFRAKLQERMVRARFGRTQSLALWFVDTDRFKSVNDTYGHATGDAVLQRMADLLRVHLVAEVDSAGRNGGDEFCALLEGVQKIVAIERAQAFCAAVRAHDFGVPVRVTASVGVAAFPYDAQTSSELLEAADAAMYHSKRAGRDRVAFAVDRETFAVYR